MAKKRWNCSVARAFSALCASEFRRVILPGSRRRTTRKSSFSCSVKGKGGASECVDAAWGLGVPVVMVLRGFCQLLGLRLTNGAGLDSFCVLLFANNAESS